MTIVNRVIDGGRSIVDGNGLMQQAFRSEINELIRSLPIVGAGTPEGVIDAVQYSLYIRTDGVSGTIEYRKMLPDIGGDTKKGWVAV